MEWLSSKAETPSMSDSFHLEKLMQLNLCINQKHNEIRQHFLSGIEGHPFVPLKVALQILPQVYNPTELVP